MRHILKPKTLGYIFAIWLQLMLVFFFLSPARFNLVQYTQIYDWQKSFLKFTRINLPVFLGQQFAALFFILIFSIISVCLGSAILQSLQVITNYRISKLLDFLTILASAFLLGQGTLAAVFLIIGSYSNLSTPIILLVLTVSLLSGIWPIRVLLKSIPNKILGFKLKNFPGNEKLVVGFAILILSIAMFLTTSRLSYDATAVYFSDAKLTALLHRVDFFRYNKFIISNFQTGILFSVLMQIFNDQTARMLAWVSGCVILIFTTAIADQLGTPRRVKLILVALLLSTTAFVDLMGDGKVDLESTSFALGTVYWLIRSWELSSKPFYILTGLLAGIAMIARPYNIPLLASFIAIYLCLQIISQKKTRSILNTSNLIPFLLLGIGMVLWGAYYLVLNWKIAGALLAPLQGVQNINSQDWQWSFDKNYIWFVRLFYPFVITFVNSSQSLGNISPLVVGFLPAFFIRDIRKKIAFSKSTIILFSSTVVVTILWLVFVFTVVEIRYIQFLLIVLFIPISVVIESIEDKEYLPLRKITDIVIIVLLLYAVIRVTKTVIDTYSPINNKGYAQCYDLPYCELETEANKVAAPGDRILTLNAYRYYLAPQLLTCTTGPDEYIRLQNASKDAEAFWAEVYRQGYKFIIYEKNYSIRHLRIELTPNPDNAPNWLKLKTIYTSDTGEEAVYEIQANNPIVNVEKTCHQVGNGIWEVQDIPDP